MNSIRSKQLSVNEKEGKFGNKDVKIKDKKDNELNVQTFVFLSLVWKQKLDFRVNLK